MVLPSPLMKLVLLLWDIASACEGGCVSLSVRVAMSVFTDCPWQIFSNVKQHNTALALCMFAEGTPTLSSMQRMSSQSTFPSVSIDATHVPWQYHWYEAENEFHKRSDYIANWIVFRHKPRTTMFNHAEEMQESFFKIHFVIDWN